jgi:autotransporter-associated beta strand protein
LTKAGSGTLTLSGTNTYSGGTTLSAGTLALGSADALGNTGAIEFAGGTLQHSSGNAVDYSSRFSTAAGQAYSIDTNGRNVTLATVLSSVGGTLTKLGTGTLTLTGDNTYDGATTISAGTLQVGVGGSSGSIAGDVLNNAALVVNRSDAITLSGDISGNGSLTQAGSGSLTLAGGNVTMGSVSGIATPIARAVLLARWFARRGERAMVIISVVLVAIILSGLLLRH